MSSVLGSLFWITYFGADKLPRHEDTQVVYGKAHLREKKFSVNSQQGTKAFQQPHEWV